MMVIEFSIVSTPLTGIDAASRSKTKHDQRFAPFEVRRERTEAAIRQRRNFLGIGALGQEHHVGMVRPQLLQARVVEQRNVPFRIIDQAFVEAVVGIERERRGGVQPLGELRKNRDAVLVDFRFDEAEIERIKRRQGDSQHQHHAAQSRAARLEELGEALAQQKRQKRIDRQQIFCVLVAEE